MRRKSISRHKVSGFLPAGMRMRADRQQYIFEVGALRIDYVRFEARIGYHELRLSRKEFEILWVLASENGRAFRRDELIERVWGRGYFIDARTVDVHIAIQAADKCVRFLGDWINESTRCFSVW
jgi:DNA-binding response OmpR family regulator